MNKGILYAAAGVTGAPGIIHLYLSSQLIGHAPNFGVFFLVAGILQLFWILPVIKKWHKGWYYGGIAGTAVLILIWSITRMPNPITGRALGVNELGIVEETMQVVFIGLSILILGSMSRGREVQPQK
jgi:hypothetical protein